MAIRVCFVCSGNICRSPTAEVVLRAQAAAAGLDDRLEIDSAGTGDWHVGAEMDRRSRATLTGAGYRPDPHVARQFTAADLADRDVVVALDREHHTHLERLAAQTPDPAASRATIVMLRVYDPELAPGEDPSIGDPYYGGPDGFTEVLAQIERSCAGLLATLASAP